MRRVDVLNPDARYVPMYCHPLVRDLNYYHLRAGLSRLVSPNAAHSVKLHMSETEFHVPRLKISRMEKGS